MKLNLIDRATEVKSLLLQGKISYDEAKEMLQPYIDEANEIARRIAKQYGRVHNNNFKVEKLLR